MPRYCLFGETVAVAEMLEEAASPNEILVSSEVHSAFAGQGERSSCTRSDPRVLPPLRIPRLTRLQAR